MSMNKQGPKGIDYLRKGYTWSPFTGCLNGCIYCWAAKTYNRFHLDFTPRFHPEKLHEPLRVKKPALIGVTFSGDMWGAWVPADEIQQVLKVCREASWHRFLFLTKNPARYAKFEIPENCWCGTSTTGTIAETVRVQTLFRNEAIQGRRFVSLEPYTGGIFYMNFEPLDWLIVGGLTGKGAKKPEPDEIAGMERLCRIKRTPIFVKTNAGVGPQEYPEGLKI